MILSSQFLLRKFLLYQMSLHIPDRGLHSRSDIEVEIRAINSLQSSQLPRGSTNSSAILARRRDLINRTRLNILLMQ